ncbi:MAG: hypothetical protein ACOX6T_17340 [Myxococcales bacterium]
MTRRQYVLLGAGVLLACLMVATVAARRALERPAAIAEASAPASADFAPAPDQLDEPDEPAQPTPRLPPGLPQQLVDMLDELDPSKPKGGEEPDEGPPSSEPLPADLDLGPPRGPAAGGPAAAGDGDGDGSDRGDGEAPEDESDEEEASSSLPADLDLRPPGSNQPPPPPASASATGERKSLVRQLGPFRVVEEEGELITIYGPDREPVVSTLRGAYIGLAGKLGRHPALLIVEKTCPDPCNPRSQLFVARGQVVEQVLDFEGMVELVDLDGKPPEELVLSRLMVTTSELVRLPFRFKRDRFVNASARFPQLIDEQLQRFGSAAEEHCQNALDPACSSALRAYLGLAIFRAGARADGLIGKLELPPHAHAFAAELREEISAEMDAFAD